MKERHLNTIENTKNNSRESQTINGIHDILGINQITQIYDGGPNYLVPNGLIYNRISSQVFEYLKSKGIKFYLDTEKKSELGYSDKHNKYIFLGLRTPRNYTKDMGIADSVDENTKTQLVFLHEMCHHLARELYDNNQNFKDLFNICKNIREKHPKNGASKLADMDFYQAKGIATQATEDCTELLRIYFMCRENESDCLESIKRNLHIEDNKICKKIFNLLAESIIFCFPTR